MLETGNDKLKGARNQAKRNYSSSVRRGRNEKTPSRNRYFIGSFKFFVHIFQLNILAIFEFDFCEKRFLKHTSRLSGHPFNIKCKTFETVLRGEKRNRIPCKFQSVHANFQLQNE